MKLLGMGVPEFLIIVGIIILVFFIFGPKNLPKLGASVGKAMKNFKDSVGGKKGKKIDDAVDGDAVVETAGGKKIDFEELGKKAGSAVESAKEIGSQVAAGAASAAKEMKAGADSVKQASGVDAQPVTNAQAQPEQPEQVAQPAVEAAAAAASEAPVPAADTEPQAPSASSEAQAAASGESAPAAAAGASAPQRRVVKRVVKKAE